MESSESIIAPPYIPFKKRGIQAVRRVTIVLLSIIAVAIIKAFIDGKFAPQNSIWYVWLIVLVMYFLLIGIVLLSQIWVLDSVIINTDKRKIRILIRKFDKVIDKGEYDIDSSFNIKINTRNSQVGSYNQFTIMYGKKKIWRQSNSVLSGSPSWNHMLLDNIIGLTNTIKNNNTKEATVINS